MSKVTYRGQLPVGEQDKLKLSTNNGLMGYRITRFQIISSAPGTANRESIAKIHTTDQNGSITSTINFNDPSLIAVIYNSDSTGWGGNLPDNAVMADGEIINQDIFINITDASGGTIPCNYFVELEKIKLDVTTSTYVTLKNIRQSKADNL
jgi:hypothetical protein